MIERFLTVVTPASTYDLTTLSAVKSELNISVSTYDTLLTGYIHSESAKLSQLCNRVFPSEVLTETLYLQNHHDTIQLLRSPVTTISSVVYSDDTLTTDDYKFDGDSGILYRISGYSPVNSNMTSRWNIGKLVVSYTAGYATIPYAIADACIQLVATRWYARARDPAIRSEEITGVGRQDFWVGQLPSGLPSSVQTAIAAYKRMPYS